MRVEGAPIFIIAFTGRCGSTLIQRMISSSSDANIYGEVPKMLTNIYKLYEQVERGVSASDTRFANRDYEKYGNLGWVARRTPEVNNDFMRKLFEAHFNNISDCAWGFKLINCTPSAMRRLSQVFPEASFILVHRNLIDVEKSAINFNWKHLNMGRWKANYADFHSFIKNNGMDNLHHIIVDYDVVKNNLEALAVQFETELKISSIDRTVLLHKIGRGLDSTKHTEIDS